MHKSKRKSKSSSSSKRKKRQREEEEQQERKLVASLFGGGGGEVEEEGDEQILAAVPAAVATGTTRLSNRTSRRRPQDELDQEESEEDLQLGIEIDRTGDATTTTAASTLPTTVDPTRKTSKSDNNDIDEYDDNESKGESNLMKSVAWMDQDDEQIATVDIVGNSSRTRKLRKHKMETTISGIEYRDRLRERFVTTASISARVDWADISRDHNDDPSAQKSTTWSDEDMILSSSAPLLSSSSSRHRTLPRDIIQLERCWFPGDVRKSRVSAVHFHPESDPEVPILLTAGLDKSLQFFRILGNKKSEKIHGIHFPKLPIMSAFFLGEKNVVVSGRRPFFYLYDSIAGKLSEHRITGRAEKSWEKTVPSTDGRTLALLGNDGYVILWDAQTKSVRSKNSIKLNGSVRAVTFSADQGRGTYLYASGSDGDVYIFDTRKDNQCVERFANADGTITSSLAVSPSNVLAVGAESGVVNLYNQDNTIKDNVGRDSSGQLQNLPSPIKSLLHITTSLDQLRFNDDGKILAFSSCRERDSLRLLHVESRTVFSNWPTSKTPLNYVYSTDFSPKSKFLAIGNDKGNCLLYRLNHYCTDEQ